MDSFRGSLWRKLSISLTRLSIELLSESGGDAAVGVLSTKLAGLSKVFTVSWKYSPFWDETGATKDNDAAGVSGTSPDIGSDTVCLWPALWLTPRLPLTYSTNCEIFIWKKRKTKPTASAGVYCTRNSMIQYVRAAIAHFINNNNRQMSNRSSKQVSWSRED